jgi:hypothetical protein
MHYFILTLLALVANCSLGGKLQASSSKISLVNNFSFLQNNLDTLTQDTLVIFDYRSVIGIHEDIYDRGYKSERSKHKTIRAIRDPQSPHYPDLDMLEREKLRAIHKKAFSNFVLIDPALPGIIRQLQERGIKVIALTRFGLSVQTETKNQRYEDLLRYGIDLSYAFPSQERINFTNLGSRKHIPTFDHGILSNGPSCSKGKLLTTFLEHANWWPKRVLFFDNSLKQIESVQKALEPFNIPFQGFEYTGAQDMPAIFNPKLEAFRLDYLVKKRRWLHSSKALQKMAKRGLPID